MRNKVFDKTFNLIGRERRGQFGRKKILQCKHSPLAPEVFIGHGTGDSGLVKTQFIGHFLHGQRQQMASVKKAALALYDDQRQFIQRGFTQG